MATRKQTFKLLQKENDRLWEENAELKARLDVNKLPEYTAEEWKAHYKALLKEWRKAEKENAELRGMIEGAIAICNKVIKENDDPNDEYVCFTQGDFGALLAALNEAKEGS